MPHTGAIVKKPFTAYKGDEPYSFVCYAHADCSLVYPDLAWLNDHGAHLWYDEGISAGTNWRATIGEALLGADSVLVYLSQASIKSQHCNREINLALDEAKRIIPIYLEEVALTPDLKIGLNRLQAMTFDTSDAHRSLLLEAIDPKTSRSYRAQNGQQPTHEAAPSRKSRSTIGMAMLVCLVVATAIAWWLQPNPATTAQRRI